MATARHTSRAWKGKCPFKAFTNPHRTQLYIQSCAPSSNLALLLISFLTMSVASHTSSLSAAHLQLTYNVFIHLGSRVCNQCLLHTVNHEYVTRSHEMDLESIFMNVELLVQYERTHHSV